MMSAKSLASGLFCVDCGLRLTPSAYPTGEVGTYFPTCSWQAGAATRITGILRVPLPGVEC